VTLFNVNAGYKEREAIHFALRQMINLATFELLTQIMNPRDYSDCRKLIDKVSDGSIENTKTAKLSYEYEQSLIAVARSKESNAKSFIPPGQNQDLSDQSIQKTVSPNANNPSNASNQPNKALTPDGAGSTEFLLNKQEIIQFSK